MFDVMQQWIRYNELYKLMEHLFSNFWPKTRGVPNILRQPAEAKYSAVLPNILPKPNRGSLFAE